MPKTKKINIKKILKNHKKNILGFKSKRWSIAVFVFMAVFAYFTQGYLDARFNPEVAQANIMHGSSKIVEAFKINDTYEVLETDSANIHYIAPDEEDALAFAFGVDANNETVVFKGIQLHVVGNIDSGKLLEARLMEGEEVLATSKVKEGEITFSKFTSILQPETSKQFTVRLDITGDILTGSRFKLQIENPYALRLYVNDEADYSLGDYPISGGYVSVVGWRK